MKITVVIPTWNRDKLLERCLASLKFVEHDRVIIVRNEYPTANARNIGIEKADAKDIIFSIDDDCFFTAEIDLLSTLKLVCGEWGCIQTTRIMTGMKRASEQKLKKRQLCWMGAGLLFRKSVWNIVGGYPKDYLDDVMFSALVYAAGFQNYISTVSYGYHDVGTKQGGMSEVLNMFGDKSFYPCNPQNYFVAGEICISKGGIPNIKNIHPLPELKKLHKQEVIKNAY